ncbi:uncharacterized protein LOC111055148 isoform X2 [Nilaparvata lugens]|uniref:uncharacterized protein LOC111055148 isoform X2 n=1 Tax=Nilaparvata lugens TaxID=108931 RepID=UPI00193E3F4D|nr:uncharacterized protein LOC111055148 isoform X2 [Nilaparvata lugens]
MCDPYGQIFGVECGENVTSSSTTTESPLYMDFGNTVLWQLLLIAGGSLSIVIIFCCCVRFRIPRTKQEIEADYIRKKITRKFQKQLRMIQDTDMDEMDLKKALDRVRAEFKTDIESIAHTEGYSGGSLSSAAGVTRMAAAETAVTAAESAAEKAPVDQVATSSTPLQSQLGTPIPSRAATEHGVG